MRKRTLCGDLKWGRKKNKKNKFEVKTDHFGCPKKGGLPSNSSKNGVEPGIP